MLFEHVMTGGTGTTRGSVGLQQQYGDRGLLTRMLQYYPDERPTAEEALSIIGADRDGPPPSPSRSSTLTAPRFVEGQRLFELIRRRRSFVGEDHGGR
jgi:hypothetical protein